MSGGDEALPVNWLPRQCGANGKTDPRGSVFEFGEEAKQIMSVLSCRYS
jgi:hypothetical protein